jgi:hypothetical protein
VVEQTLAVKQLPRHYSDPVNTDRLLNPQPSIRLCPKSKERKVESANAWSPTLLDVFCFFTGKLKQRTYAVVVSLKLRTCMIQHERQNELFHESENAQVCCRGPG